MTCRSGQKRFWNQTRLYSFVFLYACSDFMTGSESSPYNCRIWFFLISSILNFNLVSTFSICSKFFVENWLLCCDLICKWVTCRSGCKRFWKSALHILHLFPPVGLKMPLILIHSVMLIMFTVQQFYNYYDENFKTLCSTFPPPPPLD